ncbi:MAG: choline-sulfatase [Streptosporangiaceae bacterium]
MPVPPRPDILVVMADQLTPSALPVHGHPLTRTPAMSALASSGVVFDAAYTASPLCAPARAALLTGLLPSRTGVYDNAAELGAHIPTFAHHLRSAGYRTVLAGKMHFCGPDQLHGFEERLTTDIYPADFGWTPDWDHPDRRPDWYHDMSSVLQAGPCVRSNQLDFDEEVSFAAERSLFAHLRSGDPRPFCYVVSFTHPHDPFTIPRPWWDLYADADIPMPATRYGQAPPHPHERRLRAMCQADTTPVTDAQVRAARRAYYGAVSYVDDRIGRLLEVLRVTGRLDRTVVIVTSDHGEMLGERGAWYKMGCYEGSVRVPLIVSAPRLFPAGRVGEPVSTMDLMPTLTALGLGAPGLGAPGRGGAAGQAELAEVTGQVDGRSLLPLLTQAADGPAPAVAAEYLAEGAIAPIVMLRSGRHKFIHCPADPDQLFDLAADPGELTDLAADPAAAELREAFSGQVAARWDLARLDEQVRLSQRRRRAVTAALRTGIPACWDYGPAYDASRRYVRNHLPLGELELMARYPPLDGAPGDVSH